jgi:DNA-directed RNA polymerase subunit RPC12/RpoP
MDFYEKFRNEEDCKRYIKQIREQEVVVCKKCGKRDLF